MNLCLQNKNQAQKFPFIFYLLISLRSVLNLLLFQILTMGFKSFILSLLILARMSQVSKFERVLSPINVTSNLQFNFSISTSGPGPGAGQAGQWVAVHFYWLASSLSPHRALHELGGGGGLLPDDLWTPSHRFEYSISTIQSPFCWCSDDSAEYLREYLKLRSISGAVWIGLHQSKPQTQFTWT